ncbi:uncharacterized protein [Apostichopus japonicus]|uniref:uncharacterized protein n=1 Tax=Stichopus japonicus TaxID=307972 RepID=UPI003AB3FC52
MEMTLYLALIIISVVPYGFISTEGAPTHQTVENKDASICYSNHRTSDRSSIFRQTSCHGDHDLEVPPDSSIVTSLLNFIPDRHYQAGSDADVTHVTTLAQHGTTKSTERPDSTTKESVKTAAQADVTHITTLAQHDTTKSTERPDSTTEESVKTAADADVTHITTLAQHDTTKSTERPDYTTKEGVKTADADVTHITTLAEHDTTKSTERPDYTTKEGVKNQSMYWISDYMLTWSAAVDRCHQLYDNGHLVHIDNEEENNEVKAIRDQANIGNAYIWIGIHDSEKEGEWKYEDGSPLTYHNWGDGEPDDVNGQDCGVMRNNGLYHDRKCTTSYYFCCEYYL